MQKQCTYQKNDFAQRNYWNSFALCGLNQRYMLDYYSLAETAEYSLTMNPKITYLRATMEVSQETGHTFFTTMQSCADETALQVSSNGMVKQRYTDYDNCASWRIACSVFVECQKPDFDCPCNTILKHCLQYTSPESCTILSLLLTLWTTIGIRLKSSWVYLKGVWNHLPREKNSVQKGILFALNAILTGSQNRTTMKFTVKQRSIALFLFWHATTILKLRRN